MQFPRRRLPHISQAGQTVFITWRLHGSLPASRAFPRHSLTSGEAFVAMDRLLDEAGAGPQFLRRPEIAQIVVDAIHCGVSLGRYTLHAYVIMPNHVHLLITTSATVDKILKSLKGITARRANQLLGRRGPFWQAESYDHTLRTGEFDRIKRYIENNPVHASLVTGPEQHPWSSAGATARTARISPADLEVRPA